jgi:hypothetical protein
MQGPKTHEQQKRILERKDDVPDERLVRNGPAGDAVDVAGRAPKREARQSELPVSRGGLNQESRDHNKHNNPGQAGHKAQKHGPAEEKQD